MPPIDLPILKNLPRIYTERTDHILEALANGFGCVGVDELLKQLIERDHLFIRVVRLWRFGLPRWRTPTRVRLDKIILVAYHCALIWNRIFSSFCCCCYYSIVRQLWQTKITNKWKKLLNKKIKMRFFVTLI